MKVGLFKEDKYEDGVLVAMVGAVHEYGGIIQTKKSTLNIPARPFMNPTIAKNKEKWKQQLREAYRLAINGKIKPDDILPMLGINVCADIREMIRQVDSPPLADSTIKSRARRGKSGKKPLIDTGRLINSIKYKVEN